MPRTKSETEALYYQAAKMLNYCPDSGNLYWKEIKPHGKVKIGDIAGCKAKRSKGKIGSCCIRVVYMKVPLLGDRLWVRETTTEEFMGSTSFTKYVADGHISYDEWSYSKTTRPSIFMPRNLSRILLEITNVRVERLHDISAEDAKTEGIEPIHWPDLSIKYPDYVSKIRGRRVTNLLPKQSYFTLWESINGRKSLEDNPFVWVISYKVVEIKR